MRTYLAGTCLLIALFAGASETPTAATVVVCLCGFVGAVVLGKGAVE